MTANVQSNSKNSDDSFENANINLIEEFMNLSEEENKLINTFQEEFKDFKVLNYGALIYFQSYDEDISNYPHISELLENYEKIFSVNCYKGHFVLKMTKCKITSI
jgi:hypothetical protein